MRKTFHEKIDEITEDVLVMGSLVQDAVHNAIEALIKMDPDAAEVIIRSDDKVNEYDISIEEKCIVLQAEHQPVAKDLRFLHSVSILIKSIERIGDLAVNIAKVVRRLSGEKEKKHIDKDIPPSFIPPEGFSVRNSHVNAPLPFTIRYMIIPNTNRMTIREQKRSKP